MIKHLVKLAEHLDKKGHHKEADYVDWMIKSASSKFMTFRSSVDVSEFEEEIKEICRKGRLPTFNKYSVYPDSIEISFLPRKMMGKIHSFNTFIKYSPNSGADNPGVRELIRKDLYDSKTSESQRILKALNNAGRKLAKELGASVSDAASSSTGVAIYFKEPVVDSME